MRSLCSQQSPTRTNTDTRYAGRPVTAAHRGPEGNRVDGSFFDPGTVRQADFSVKHLKANFNLCAVCRTGVLNDRTKFENLRNSSHNHYQERKRPRVWKTVLLSAISAHKVGAIILVILTMLSTTVFVYTFTGLPGASCPPNAKAFTNISNLYHTVFGLASPGKGVICMSVRISGQVPLGGLDLAPTIELYSTGRSGSTLSSCTNSFTNCGGVSVLASPERALPYELVHTVVTINAPSGSIQGVYILWFWACSGGTILSLKISELNQSIQKPSPASPCPLTQFHVNLTLDSYAGIIPVYQNATVPIALP